MPESSKKCEVSIEIDMGEYVSIEEELRELAGWAIPSPTYLPAHDLVLDYSLNVGPIESVDSRLMYILTLMKLAPDAVIKGDRAQIDELSIFLEELSWKLKTISQILVDKDSE